MDDTIAAIATPIGVGGIGIIRISGQQALGIAKKIFHPRRPVDLQQINFKLVYGQIKNPATGDFVDEVLLGVMRGPNTYTREDVIEINCHGGLLVQHHIMELVLKQGARLAEPGEFTKRAFLKGRLDLTQAEAVIDIITSSTGDALKIAQGQLQGQLARQINAVGQQLLEIVAIIEANIDFPEDDVEEYQLEQIRQQLSAIDGQITRLIQGAKTGKVYREGLKTVIVGKPNVGKSSLLNVLLQEKRAIVTDIPGTTRDVIEEVLNIKGLPLVLTDTAGIRVTDDAIEKIGVQKTKASIARADLILFLFDAAGQLNQQDDAIVQLVQHQRGIKILNKIDLDVATTTPGQLAQILPSWPQVEISALTEQGLSQLEQQIYQFATSGLGISPGSILVTNVRHQHLLEKTHLHVQEAREAIEAGLALDLIAVDIRAAWEAIGEIKGTAITENIVDKIFADFCIGK